MSASDAFLVQKPDDAIAAFNYSKVTGVTIVIENTGAGALFLLYNHVCGRDQHPNKTKKASTWLLVSLGVHSYL